MALQPAVFLSVYASMTLPAMPWGQLYGVGVLVCWFCTSLGALASLLAPPSNSLMATVAVLMVRPVPSLRHHVLTRGNPARQAALV